MQNTTDGMMITNEKNEIIENKWCYKKRFMDIQKLELIGKIQNSYFKYS